MRFGTSFALNKLEDVGQLRDMTQTLDRAGIDFIALAGHVMAQPPGTYEGRPPFTFAGPFRDPFVLFSYLAGMTTHIEFRNSILILPLYQTALLAKMAADLSIVSGGRYGMGVGLSWNEAEYQSLGQDIHTRGRRMEEQIQVLRKLWTEPFVTFEGRWHKLDRVGLNQLPEQPIPIWIGCNPEERQLRRVAKYADGWMPMVDPAPVMPTLRQYLTEAGRDPAKFLLTGRLAAGPEGPDAWVATAKELQASGVTDITLSAPPDLGPAETLQRVIDARNALAAALS